MNRKRNRGTETIMRRRFTHSSVEEFKHLLSNELRNYVYNRLDVNSSSEAFLETCLHCFNPLTPNDHYSCRTAPLTSKRCILYIYSTN